MDELSRLQPDRYGLMPTDPDTYIALAVKHYLLALGEEDRKRALRNLIQPKVVKMDGSVLATAVDRQGLAFLAEYATHEALKALGNGMAEDAVKPGVDIEAAVGLKAMAADAVRKSYDAFRAEDMSEELEAFLTAVWNASIH